MASSALNLFLFETAPKEILLPPDDPRTVHVREVLRRVPGDDFDVAVMNGPRGKATVVKDGSKGLSLSFKWEEDAEDDRLPIHLLAGLPRPQTARKILEQAATIGVISMDFFGADKGEPSYADSKLWMTDEWRRHLVRGVEQAFCSFLPEVRHHANLKDAIAELPQDACRFALDLYEAQAPLFATDATTAPSILAFGPERGWSGRERNLLRDARFDLRRLGSRVLRQETACIAALGILAAPHW